ncbi:hypothetical protein FJY90_04275, partial [Candidatus Gottesmanbacteria bacterium]|nr:hypothetical protein [Candidatus Gottesmanbacteria bacterium]
SLKEGKLKVFLASGVLDKEKSQDRQLAFSLFPPIPDDKIIHFSLNLEEAGTDTESGQKDSLPSTTTEISDKDRTEPPFSKEAKAQGLAFYTVEYSLSDLAEVYAISTLKFVWRNQESGQWEDLPTEINKEKGILTTKLTHLSDFGVKGQKAQVFAPTLKSWETNLYTGAVTYSFPIEVLPGRGGLKPSISGSYNSNTANSLFEEQKGSWLGAGWDMSLPEVRFDSYTESGLNCNQAAGTRLEGPQYSLILTGSEGPLAWIGDDSDSDGSYGKFIAKGSNLEVKGYYGRYSSLGSGFETLGNSCRNKLIRKWLARDTSGTKYFFEVKTRSQDTGNQYDPAAANRKIKDVLAPSRYSITKITDLSGNTIDFEYQVPDWAKNETGEHYFSNYPFKIKYNGGNARIEFSLEQKANAPTKPSGETGLEKNLELGRLKGIQVFSAPDTIYRTYNFLYESKENFDTLKKIEIYGPGTPEGKNRFVPTEFEYASLPVGLQTEYLGGEYAGCSGGKEFHPVRATSWDDLKNKLNSLPAGQKEKLTAAGFQHCSGEYGTRPTNDGCPKSAENEFYTTWAFFNDLNDEDKCKPHEEQGSKISWEKNKAPFISRVKNGYGGELIFSYQNLFNSKFGLNRNVVAAREVVDNSQTHTPSIRAEYLYEAMPLGDPVRPNKGGGFGRVTQKDPITGMMITTFYYPLAPADGDGSVDPEKNPFYGLPLRTVTHKVEGGGEKIYSDQFFSYSFIPPYAPNIGLTKEELSSDRSRPSWKGWTLQDNLLSEGFGKKVTAVADQFAPKSASFVSVPIDNDKPQYIPETVRREQMLHTQTKSWFDRYGYTTKTASFADVVDSPEGGFDVSSGSNLRTPRKAQEAAFLWWLEAEKFTFGLPMTPLLFAAKIQQEAHIICKENGAVNRSDHPGEPCRTWDICCGQDGKSSGEWLGCPDERCTEDIGNLRYGGKIECNHNAANQCLIFSSRPVALEESPSTGTAGSLKKYAYTKYIRDSAYLALNISGLTEGSFISETDAASYDSVSEANRWNWTTNGYDENSTKRGLLTSSTKHNTYTSADRLPSPDTITAKSEYDTFGNVKTTVDAKGVKTTTSYSSPDKPYDNILPVENSQIISKELTMTTTTVYNDTFWLPEETTDPNGAVSKTTYDCLGRIQEAYKPDPLVAGNLSTLPSVTNLYFDYQASGCGLGEVRASNPLPHLRSKTRLSSSVSDNIYLYADQISDGWGQIIQSIAAKTKVEDEDKSLISETFYNNRGLKEAESSPIDSSPVNLSSDTSPAPRYVQLTAAQKQNRLTSYTYDELGRVTEAKDPLGKTTRTQYSGLKTWLTDAENSVKTSNQTQTITEVNGFGQNIKTTFTNLPDSTNPTYALITIQEYDLAGNVVSVNQKKCHHPTCASGGEQTLSTATVDFDHLGRKWRSTDPDLGVWKYAYDENGNIVRQVDAKGQEMQLDYDSLNRLTKKRYPGTISKGLATVRNTINFFYDKDPTGEYQQTGKLVRMEDLAGDTSFRYDLRGRVTEEKRNIPKTITGQKEDESFTATYEYYDSDLIKTTVLPTGERVEQKLNEAGQITGLTGQNEYLRNQVYNRLGSPTKGILGNGLTAVTRFDDLGRMTQICVGTDCNSETPAGKLMNYRFTDRDNIGNIKQLKNDIEGSGAFTLNYTYDNLYQLKSATGQPYSASYEYNFEGSLTQKTEGEDKVTMGYADSYPHHAPKTVNGAAYQYDANGNLVKDETREYIFDYDNKPISITMLPPCTFEVYGELRDVNNRILANITNQDQFKWSNYKEANGSFPAAGPARMEYKTESLPESLRNTTAWIQLNNLPAGWQIAEKFCEDHQGNGCPADNGSTSAKFENMPFACNLSYTYGWRVKNNLSPTPTSMPTASTITPAPVQQGTPTPAATTAKFLYDGKGARVIRRIERLDGKTETTLYFGSVEKTLETGEMKIYYSAGNAVAVRTILGASSTLNYLHPDWLGSTALVTKADGTKEASIVYYPYGNEVDSLPTTTDRFYTGQKKDV